MKTNFDEYRFHVVLTPSDSVKLVRVMRVYCNNTGAIAVKDVAGNSVTYTLTAGQFVPVLCTMVLSTGTTSTSVIGLF